MTQETRPDHVLTADEVARYQELADRTGEVVVVTDSRPGQFYPRQAEKEAE